MFRFLRAVDLYTEQIIINGRLRPFLELELLPKMDIFVANGIKLIILHGKLKQMNRQRGRPASDRVNVWRGNLFQEFRWSKGKILLNIDFLVSQLKAIKLLTHLILSAPKIRQNLITTHVPLIQAIKRGTHFNFLNFDHRREENTMKLEAPGLFLNPHKVRWRKSLLNSNLLSLSDH